MTEELLKTALKNLGKVCGIEAELLITRAGVVLTANMPANQKPETFAAMAATMVGAAETAAIELGKGIPEKVIAETDSGKIIAIGAGPKALLVIAATSYVNLGLVLIETEKTAQKIKEILG